MRNQLRFIGETLYDLKKDYGLVGDVYRITGETVDPETGVRTTVREKHRIKKMILLPTNLTAQMFIAGGYVRPDPSFPSSGWEVTDTFVIIDHKDVTFEIKKEDYIVIQHKRYNIKSINEVEPNIGLLIGLKSIKGAEPQEIFTVSARNTLTFNQSVTPVVVTP